MSVLSHRRASRAALLTAAGSLAAATALLAAPSATALGAPYADFDTLTVSPAASSYADGTTVTVSGSGLAPGAYDLSVCEYDSYATAVRPGASVPIPACGVDIVPVTVSAAGIFSATVTLETAPTNAHANIGGPFGGQPAALDLDANLGEFVLVPGHGSGFGGSHAADSAEFNVS